MPFPPHDSQADTLADELAPERSVLVVGSTARDHALCWRLAMSPSLKALWIWPGNPGMAHTPKAKIPPISAPQGTVPAEVWTRLAQWCRDERVDLAIVMSEEALLAGLVDQLQGLDVPTLGPDSSAVRIEASKMTAKMTLEESGVPTPRGEGFADTRHARRFCQRLTGPWVVKADGPAGGRGVVVCPTLEKAYEAIDANLTNNIHGKASRYIMVEEFVAGEELCVHALMDGETLLTFPVCQPVKRLHNGETGPLTAGMGAFAPSPYYTHEIADRVRREILEPLLNRLKSRFLAYRGFLRLLMVLEGSKNLKVIALHTTPGNPDFACVAPMIEGDLLGLLVAASHRQLGSVPMVTSASGAAMAVVMASRGFPVSPILNQEIHGAAWVHDPNSATPALVFHHDTSMRHGKLVTSGGRPVVVVGRGSDLGGARDQARDGLSKVRFDGQQMRTDVGEAALQANMLPTSGG